MERHGLDIMEHQWHKVKKQMVPYMSRGRYLALYVDEMTGVQSLKLLLTQTEWGGRIKRQFYESLRTHDAGIIIFYHFVRYDKNEKWCIAINSSSSMQIKEDILEGRSVQLYSPSLLVGQSGAHYPNSLLKEIVNYKYDQIIHTFFRQHTGTDGF